MGAYKVGKIAQNRVSFLSNNLAEESWVKDREWAIANQIRGFAGFPLTAGNRVLGVLATFSQNALTPEFLEVLQVLCTMVSVGVETALRYQQEQPSLFPAAHSAFKYPALSDQLATILNPVRLTLIGTEQPLTLSHTHLFLQFAEGLIRLGCRYCRLLYQEELVALEAITTAPDAPWQPQEEWVQSHFGLLFFAAACLGGRVQSQAIAQQKVLQISLELPYPRSSLGPRLRIQCRLPLVQMAFTHLAFLAGLRIVQDSDGEVPLLTDDVTQIQAAKRVLWVQQGTQPLPRGLPPKWIYQLPQTNSGRP